MPMKGWVCRFEGRELRVVNTWFSGIKLYVDGVEVARQSNLFSISKNTPVIHYDLAGHPVQVFVVAVLTTQAAIFVDGLQYGGDELDISADVIRFATPTTKGALSANTGSAVAVPTMSEVVAEATKKD